MAAGEFSAEELTKACLERIAERESTVGAWAFLDEKLALGQARALDEKSSAGEPLGPLHGLPVGIKDIVDSYDMPSECGSAYYQGRRPLEDSALAAMMRRAAHRAMAMASATSGGLGNSCRLHCALIACCICSLLACP